METRDLIQHRIERDGGRGVVSAWTAAAILTLGCFHAVPAIVHLINLPETSDSTLPVSRWIFCCFLLTGIYVAYAVYAFQISDWSVLFVVAILQLGMAALFAVLCGALYVDRGSGLIGRFLQIPRELNVSATIWCATLMCICGLFSYVAWREASRWKQIA